METEGHLEESLDCESGVPVQRTSPQICCVTLGKSFLFPSCSFPISIGVKSTWLEEKNACLNAGSICFYQLCDLRQVI